MIHGLVENWKFPYWIDFDTPITKQLFDEIVISLELCGNTVLSMTMDQGGSNEGFQNSLGTGVDDQSYQNPAYPDDPSKVLYFVYDYVHAEKLWRNALLKHSVRLDNGQIINAKKQFQELSNYCRSHELSAGYYLKDILIHCKKSDLQTVKFAINLMSNTTASLFRQYFPNDGAKMALADMCDVFHNGIST